jgi:hypothetical protein
MPLLANPLPERKDNAFLLILLYNLPIIPNHPPLSYKCPYGMARPIPNTLQLLIALTVEYWVLNCIGGDYANALKPTAISQHLYDRYKTTLDLRKKVYE